MAPNVEEEAVLKQQLKRLTVLKETRERLFTQAQKAYDNCNSATVDNIEFFRPRYEKLDTLESDMDSVQKKIIELNAELLDITHVLPVCQVQSAFDDLIYSARGRFLNLMKSIPPRANDVNEIAGSASANNSLLPRIDIPIFTGRIEEWTAFYSLFDSVVDKSRSLSASEKFQYLRSYLKGDALAVISHYQLTDVNYPLAYQALKLRYQNKRRLASFYVNQIRDFSPASSPSYNQLKQFLTTHSNSISALKALALPDLSDFLLLQLSLSNLDPVTRKAFETKQNTDSIPTYQSLIDFVTDQSRTYEIIAQDSKPCKSKPTTYKPAALLTNVKNVSSSSKTENKVSCVLCKGSHSLPSCNELAKKSLEQKYSILKQFRRCFNCLGNHTRNDCSSRNVCRLCHSNRHHTLLHHDQIHLDAVSSPSDEVANVPESPAAPQLTTLACQSQDNFTFVLLATVKALIADCCGTYRTVRAVIDPGSQVSAITSSLVQQLRLKRSKSSFEINGISNTPVKTMGSVQCVLSSRYFPHNKISLQAVVLSGIPGTFPSRNLSSTYAHHFGSLDLADPQFYQPSRVDLLIGADIFPHLLVDSNPSVIPGAPSTMNTIFGWIIIGSTASPSTQDSTSLLNCVDPLDQMLQKFWETDNGSADATSFDNPQDTYCEEHFRQTHSRDPSGRYIVKMPQTQNTVSLATNRNASLRCYLKLESKLSRNSDLNQSYHSFLEEYLQLGHMQLAPRPSSYVLPHHCVLKQSSSSTKLRVVFNGSSQDSQGVSLNQQLLPGPKLQKDLNFILLRFRLHNVALIADIKMMYRQILLSPEQRYLQHIFWRPHAESPVQEYELNTVTYGLTPSAYLTQRVLLQLAADEGQDFPLATKALADHTYVDNVVTGTKSIESCNRLRSELNQLLSLGGFQLRKWASNCPAVLSGIPTNHLEKPLHFDDAGSAIKILGLMWDPLQDSFVYYVQEFDSSVTKRNILSYIARIFDPLQWLAPVVFWTKHFLQRLWLAKIGWDDPLPIRLTAEWNQFSSQMIQLRNFKIPRPMLHENRLLRLVGFCDASEKGYAAVIYLHSTSPERSDSYLLKSKCKVAPLKTLTIPRLELCGALLLAKLLHEVKTIFQDLSFESVHLFTDSKTVLAWLRTPPHTLKTFVANRVVRILDDTQLEQWFHVPSTSNPADLASRGASPGEIIAHSNWWNGPPFLTLPPDDWPANAPSVAEDCEIPERKINSISLQVQIPENDLIDWMSRFSSLTKLRRVVAYMLRLCRRRSSSSGGPLSTKELRKALHVCVRLVQRHYYADLLHELRTKTYTRSSLKKLSPFVDQEGLIRVGGRLRHSLLSEDAKHPFLLPKAAHLSILICDYYHIYSLHSGPNATQALIQQQFWIVSLRSLVRERIFKCIRCLRFKVKPQLPIMADLPAARVRLQRPFSHIGLDFAGPFLIKESRRRTASRSKGYLCIAVCMATKAVHLELVSDLSTKAFLASLDRLSARRGLPTHVYSDCGTNFIGASRELKKLASFLRQNSEDIYTSLAAVNIEWHFNPPSAPHFGGLWEAAVKSAKGLLHRLVGTSSLTFEEYATLFCKIEAALNSRPLCGVASTPDDAVDYLSPGHFLVGGPLLQPPDLAIPENVRLSCRWQRIRQISQSFWKRWSREYLHTQIQRKKWAAATPNLQPGTVVLIRGIECSPLAWPIGRVEAVYPGADGVVRVANIRTAGGVYTRPVHKLLVLPISA